MKADHISEHPLEDIATTTVTLGRKLAALANEQQVGGNSRHAGFVSRTLHRIGDRRPFDSRDDAALDEIRRIIIADLNSECLGTKTHFVEAGYDADGPVTEARERNVYTERGEELVRVLDLFETFMTARAATLDRAAAERAIRQLASG